MSTTNVKLIFLGDVFGDPGRQAIKSNLAEMRERYAANLVIVNCENAARGRGITKKMATELLDAGVDFMTSGNHIFGAHDIYNYLNEGGCKIIRPHNLPGHAPGKGVGIVESQNGCRVGVINMMGDLFMPMTVGLPFDAMDDAIAMLTPDVDVIVADMHAETTSEKRAMGWHVDGRVQLLVGTHTHVQTADEEILPGGTAYITDLGMCGPYDSVIGMDKNIILKRLRTALPQRFEVASGDVRLCGVFCEIDPIAKKAIKIERILKKIG